MVHNEMSFLFNPTIQPTVGDPIRVNNNNNTGDIFGTIPTKTKARIYKDPGDGKNVIDYVNNKIYARDRLEQDPYVTLLNYFNDSGTKGPISMILKPADFVYLKDLGVYPINRLIILRRYRDGCIVPNNLTLFKEKPIATVIGWIKVDDSNKDLFSFSFGESWVDQTDTLDKVIGKIMKEQFGVSVGDFLPVPAWSQGFLFGMLNRMGLTTYSATNVPTGDPNVLRTSKMREVESQSLKSDLKITFETSYEQKYIDKVDPGLAFQDILSNLARIGTSDQRFILNADNNNSFSKFVEAVNAKAEYASSAWVAFGKQLIDEFMGAITDFFYGEKSEFAPIYDSITKENVKLAGSDTERDKKIASLDADIARFKKLKDKSKNNKEFWDRQILDKENKKNEILNPKEKPKIKQDSLQKMSGAKETFDAISGVMERGANTLLAGSVYRYRWPLIGSIGLMSGLSTTPWHLTVGNPFSPILSMGNVYLENGVDLKFSNELGFQDMPKRVDVTIDLKMGRPLGRWEIERMFNNQYGRVYTKAAVDGGTLGEVEITAKRESIIKSPNGQVNLDLSNFKTTMKPVPTLNAIVPNDKTQDDPVTYYGNGNFKYQENPEGGYTS